MNTTNFSVSRTAVASACLAMLVSCGGSGDDNVIHVPDALGLRVVYAADAKGSPVQSDAYTTDTDSSPPTITQIFTGSHERSIGLTLVSPDGRFVGAQTVDDNTFCPSRLKFVDTMNDDSFQMFGDDECVVDARFDAAGHTLAVMITLSGGTGRKLLVSATTNLANVANVVDTAPSPSGTVIAFEYAGDSGTIAWSEGSGLYSSSLAIAASPGIASLRSADTPSEFKVTRDGAHAVYLAPGEQRFRVTLLTPGAGMSQSYLTAALAGGDTIDDFALSPDGTQLLYTAQIGGQMQLWLVPLAAPLTEQRVDGGAPLSNFITPLFAFSPDSARFAWMGLDLTPALRLFTATIAAPTTAVALTPASETPHSILLWPDADTVAYDEVNLISGSATLRSVAVSAPLASVAISPVNGVVPGVDRAVLCSDGTLVYRVKDLQGVLLPEAPPKATALYSVTAMHASSIRQIAPTVVDPAFGYFTFVCQ